MKKLINKVRRRKQPLQPPARITNETVAEHRERILAGGRRFKYPVQYARHKLVFNTVIITISALIILTLVGWWQLYIVQNTNTFFYQVARILPLPVATVDGEQVRYGDYLMYLRSSLHYLRQSEQINLSTKDGQRQADFIKRQSMDNVIADAYAQKLARERGIVIKDSQIDQVIAQDRDTANGRISQEAYDASALTILNWLPNEYRQDAKSKLIRQEVAYAIDTYALKTQQQAAQLLAQSAELERVAEQLGGDGDGKVTVGTSGLVPLTNRDGGLSTAAAKLQPGQVSPVIKTTTGDGYYFVKLLEKTDTQINYAFLRVPLTELNKRLSAVKKDGKIKEYISISEQKTQQVKQ